MFRNILLGLTIAGVLAVGSASALAGHGHHGHGHHGHGHGHHGHGHHGHHGHGHYGHVYGYRPFVVAPQRVVVVPPAYGYGCSQFPNYGYGSGYGYSSGYGYGTSLGISTPGFGLYYNR